MKRMPRKRRIHLTRNIKSLHLTHLYQTCRNLKNNTLTDANNKCWRKIIFTHGTTARPKPEFSIKSRCWLSHGGLHHVHGRLDRVLLYEPVGSRLTPIYTKEATKLMPQLLINTLTQMCEVGLTKSKDNNCYIAGIDVSLLSVMCVACLSVIMDCFKFCTCACASTFTTIR